jgi:hypothetical protein
MGANDRQIGGDHYQTDIQHWDYVIANNIPYLEAQIIKYLTRWHDKDGHEDLKKAQHFLQKLFETEGLEWNQERLHGTDSGEDKVARKTVSRRHTNK